MRITLSLAVLAGTLGACDKTPIEPLPSAAIGTYALVALDDGPVPGAYRETDWPCSAEGGGLLGCYCPAAALPFDTIRSGTLQVKADGEFAIEWIVQPAQSASPGTATCTATTGWWTETAPGVLRLSNAVCFIDGCFGPLETVDASDPAWVTGTTLEIAGTNGLNGGLQGRFVKD